MKLAELRPEFRRYADDASLYEIAFDCPVCGAPWRCMIRARLGGPPGPEGTWAWAAAPFSNVPPVPLDWGTVTITPSVRNRHHGRKRLCSAHFNVVAGEVVPA